MLPALAPAASYFETTVLPELKALGGFVGASLLGREVGDGLELTVHTTWEPMAAVRAFAGADVTTAKVEPEALGMLRDGDPAVVHRTVLVSG